jgi:amino acid transporter
MAFGLLAFINEAAAGNTVFNWLIALTGLASFFVWGSICLSHIRFRQGWRAAGRTTADLPFKSPFGVWGSTLGLFLVILCLVATFYVALYPVGGSPNAQGFFESYLAGPIVIALFVFWKVWSRDWKFGVKLKDMDLDAGRRDLDLPPLEKRKLSVVRRLSEAVF